MNFAFAVLLVLGALPVTAVTVTWTGAVSGYWDTSTFNWTNVVAGVATNYSDGYVVQFDDTASGNSPVLVNNALTVSPGGIVVTNATKFYIISGGGIAGSGNLIKSGVGTLSLTNVSCTYTGSTTISAGTLRIDGTSLLGGNTYTQSVTNNGTFYYKSSTDETLSGNISGSGALDNEANSGGSLTLGGSNSYSGNTINRGTLVIANPNACGTGQLQLLGGTLDATVTNLANNAVSFAWDWTFAGSTNLDLGTGTVTLSANKSQTITKNTLTVGGPIVGSGQSITKKGSGTLVFNGVNTYTGPTTNSAGTLLVNGNSSATTNIWVVASGATLGGAGTVGGPVTSLSGGIIAPGSSTKPGILTLTNSMTFSSGSYLSILLSNAATAGNTYDQLVIKGTNTVSGNCFISLSAVTATVYHGTYVLITNANFATTGGGLFVFPNGSTNWDLTAFGGGILTLTNAANSLVLNVSADTPATSVRPTNYMPTGLVIASGDKSVILHWEPNSWSNHISGFNVYRSLSPSGLFVLQDTSTATTPGISDVTVANGQTYYYQVTTVLSNGLETVPSVTVSTTPQPFADDNAFLDYLQQASFDFYWYDSNPDNGLSPEANDSKNAEIFGTGFELTAIGIGIDHGWISRTQGVARVIKTLNTFLNGPQGSNTSGIIGYKGWFYGVLNMTNALRNGTAELPDIDNSFLECGLLYAKQYFNSTNSDETSIRNKVDTLVNGVDWTWMAQGPNKDRMPGSWSPEVALTNNGNGFSSVNYSGYSEAMVMYQLGLGAATNPLPLSAWSYWTSTYRWITNYNTNGYLSFPSGYMYTFGQHWTDLRHSADPYMTNKNSTYFETARQMIIAHRNYCTLNPSNWPSYGSNCWGLNPSQDAGTMGLPSWSGHGVPPNSNYIDDGTIAPCVAGGAIAFAPEYAVPCLRNIYDTYRTNIWIECGFCDAFNLRVPWFSTTAGNEEQAAFVIMIENYRTQKPWKLFAQNAEFQRGQQRAGFVPVPYVTQNSPQAQPASNRFTLTWPATTGRTYQVEYSPDLINWFISPGGSVKATNGTASWTDSGPPGTPSVPLTGTQQFYRVFRFGP